MSRYRSTALALVIGAWGSTALASNPEAETPPPNRGADVHLEAPPPWSATLGAYGGLGLHFGRQEPIPHSLGGLRLKFTVWHIELGAYAELAELPGLYQNSFGGLLGFFLPFHNFVDLEGGVGMGVRRYLDCGAGRSCAMHPLFSTPALTARFGFSDRVGRRLGARLGAELQATFDFGRKNVHWRIEASPEAPGGISGVRHFGGSSVGLVVHLALDWVSAY